MKHLRALTAANVTVAVPGPKGGYRLSRSPEEISMLDIVEAIDGAGPAYVCREIRKRGEVTANTQCAYKKDCFIKRRMLAAEEAWRIALRCQSLWDLLDDADIEIGDYNAKAVGEFIADKQR